MIESKTLGEAVGVQHQGVKDLSETSNPSSLSNGYIIGRFKRGRSGVPFKVTKDNFQAKLGADPKNPDYLAVEDCFRLGLSEVTIMRGGSSVKATTPPQGGGTGTGTGTGISYIHIK